MSQVKETGNNIARRTLPESFIREFSDRVDWTEISSYQKLSEEFIWEFKDRVDWNEILIKFDL